MNLREKAYQIFKLAEDAVWFSNYTTIPRLPSPDLDNLPKKPYENMEVQPSAEEQLIYMMADSVISADEGLQHKFAREFLQRTSVSSFVNESGWQGIALHGYMIPHISPEAQLYVFKSMCDLSESKSDDFGSEMIGAVQDMDVSVRTEAVDYVQDTKFMNTLQMNDAVAYVNDMSKLYALLPEDRRQPRRWDLNHFFRDVARENRKSHPEIAATQLRAARHIGKGRHAEPA